MPKRKTKATPQAVVNPPAVSKMYQSPGISRPAGFYMPAVARSAGSLVSGSNRMVLDSLQGAPKMSVCAQKYAVALTAPFDPAAIGACIPKFPAIPSRKLKGWVRGQLTIGAGGYGFIALLHSTASDAPTAYYSDDITYAGTAVLPAYVGGAGMAIAYMTNLNQTYNQVSNQNINGQAIYTRIVASGATLEYTGTTLAESGLYTAYHEPNHISLINETATALTDRDGVLIQRVSERRKSWVNGLPSVQAAFNYSTSTSLADSYPWARGATAGAFPVNSTFPGGVAGVPISVIFVSGTPGQTAFFELVTHLESLGETIQSQYTDSVADDQGFALVNAAAETVPREASANPLCPPVCAILGKLKSIAKQMAPVAANAILGPAAATAVSALVGVL